MTEIEQYDPTAEVAPFASQDVAVQRLAEWAQSAQAAYQVAESLVRTSFVPEAFRGKPHEATAAILSGLEVGLSPMASLRSFDVIQGQAAPRAITLRAIVQSKGHVMDLIESTSTRCVMQGVRRGTTKPQRVTWTIDRAKDLGLTSKHNWKAQPQAMLVARATSELARLIAADAILGIAYTAEELADGATIEQEVAAQTVDPTPSGTRTLSRKRAAPKPPPAPEPESTEPVDAEEVAGDDGGITDAQMKMLHASFNDVGVTDRDGRLDYCTNLLGREVTTSKELTKGEASRVIDALRSDAEGEQS